MTYVETYPAHRQDYTYSEDDFDGSSAAPLLIVGGGAKRRVINSQDAIASNFIHLAQSELDSYVKPPIIEFVSRSIISRMHQREGLNGNSFIQRENQNPDYTKLPLLSPEEIDEACEKSKYGNARVLQNEIARKAFGMKSVEYANLTIIGDVRKHLEPDMWSDVGRMIHADAVPKAGQMYGHQVLGFDRDIRTSSHIGAMRVGMKRLLGETDYGAVVKARTTAIVNLSPSSGVNPDLIELFKDTARSGKDIADLPEFKSAVHWLVETELPSGLVLARNETVYGVEN